MIETYEIVWDDIVKCVGDISLVLQEHIPMSEGIVVFPDKFFVKIDQDSDNDKSGLQYFVNVTDDVYFLKMGFYDSGFYPTVGFLKLIAKKIA